MSTYLKLHFISGKYQGGTYLLGDGEAVSIGRGNDVTLTLFEEMVSRRHVEFVNDEGTAHVEDLGSKTVLLSMVSASKRQSLRWATES